MKTRKTFSVVLALVLALGIFVPVTWSSERDQASQLTFTQSVQLPGNVVLPPGTYWFTVADSPSNRNIIRVFDLNWQPITIAIAASAERIQPTVNTLLTFAERSTGQPDALLEWYYPGETIGHEFVYSGPEGRVLSEETVNVVAVAAQPAPMVRATGANPAKY